MQLQIAAKPASSESVVWDRGKCLRNFEIAREILAIVESSFIKFFQMFRQFQFAIEAGAAHKALFADFFQAVGQLQFANETCIQEGVYTGYSFERRRQRQRAVESTNILEGSVFDVGHAFRNVERSGESAFMEGRTSDLL